MTLAKTQRTPSINKIKNSKLEIPVRTYRRERRELNFRLSGDDDKQNIPQIRVRNFCPIVVSRLGKRDFLSVLCVSAVKYPNLYLRVSAKICGQVISESFVCCKI